MDNVRYPTTESDRLDAAALCDWTVHVVTTPSGYVRISCYGPGEGSDSIHVDSLPPLVAAALGRALCAEAQPGLDRLAALLSTPVR